MASLILYNHDFNIGELLHVCFDKKADYLTFLNAYKLGEVPIDSWRYNSLTALISDGYLNTNKIDPNAVAYIAIVPDDQERTLFFHVVSWIEQSGYVSFTLAKDLWGDGFATCDFPQLTIDRCNKKITGAKGIFDDFENVDTDETRIRGDDEPMDNYRLVALIAYVLDESKITGESITQTGLFYFTPSDVVDQVNPLYQGLPVVGLLSAMIGGIHSGKLGIGNETKAEVIKAWIAPKDAVVASLSSPGNYGFNVKSYVAKENAFLSGQACVGNSLGMDFYRQEFQNLQAKDYISYCNIAFGPMGREMKMRKAMYDYAFYIDWFIESAGVRAELCNGDNREDVTESFSLTLSVNNSNATATEKIQKAVGKLGAVIGSTALGYAKGGVAGAVVGAGTSALASVEKGKPTASSSAGDASTIFYIIGKPRYFKSPYNLVIHRAIGTPKNDILYNGIKYNDTYTSDIRNWIGSVCKNTPYVIDDANIDWTFLKCVNTCVEKANRETADFIAQELNRGIKIKYL